MVTHGTNTFAALCRVKFVFDDSKKEPVGNRFVALSKTLHKRALIFDKKDPVLKKKDEMFIERDESLEERGRVTIRTDDILEYF